MSLIPSPYDPEWTEVNAGVFNDGPGGGGYGSAGGSIANPDPSIAPALPAPPTPGYKNPCTSTTIPINSGGGNPLLIANPRRSLIILQNNSNAVAPDVGPVLWFAFGRPAVPGQCQGLAPSTVANGIGEGIVLDYKVPRDTLYVTFGPAVNGGGTVQTLGAVTEGIDDVDQDYHAPIAGGVAPHR